MRLFKGLMALALAALLNSGAYAQTIFGKYEPANGIQKNTGTTYVNTAAVAADIYGLWSGTCSATTFLSGSGACSAISLTTGITGTLPTGNGGTGNAGSITGPIKGNGASPYTAAASADIYGLWSGTCSASTFLRGDGACAAAGGGTVTSIIAGTGLTGGTITTTGTIALSTPVSAANGGTGEAGTVTGVAKANGASAYTAALAADVYGLWSGTCSSSTFLRGDGACASVGSGTPGGANTQVQYNNAGAFGANSGFTYDGSGDITLTGNVVATGTNHIFGATSAQSFGTNITARTDGSHFAIYQSSDGNGNQICIGLNVSGSTQCNILTGNFGIGYNTILPFGIYRNGVSQLGFTTAGAATFVSSVSATSFSGSGSGLTSVPDSALTANVAKYTDSGTNFSGATPPTIGGSAICVASGTNCPAGSATTGSYTATTTGCTTAPTVTVTWTKLNNAVSLFIPSINCTSNASTFTLTGGTGGMVPNTTVGQASPFCLDNNVSNTVCALEVAATGTITFDKLLTNTYSNSAWTSSGQKGGGPWTITYKSL